MFKAISIGAFTVTAALALSGCQLFDAPRIANAADRNDRGQKTMPANHALAIEEGRSHLRANRSGMAIDAFNRGLAQGEDPAAAYNGLGVAYSRIGRADLAYRFFKKAATSEPDNPVYWRNLALLIDTPEYRLAVAPSSKPDVPAASLANRDMPGVASPKTQGAQLVRNGNHQFNLVTAPSETAPGNSGTNAALTSCETKTRANPCRQRALPVSGSRSRISSRNDLSQAATSRSPGTSAVPAGEPQVPSGKRKIVDLPELKSEARGDETKPKASAGSNEPA